MIGPHNPRRLFSGPIRNSGGTCYLGNRQECAIRMIPFNTVSLGSRGCCKIRIVKLHDDPCTYTVSGKIQLGEINIITMMVYGTAKCIWIFNHQHLTTERGQHILPYHILRTQCLCVPMTMDNSFNRYPVGVILVEHR
jgi:hypothetical protein